LYLAGNLGSGKGATREAEHKGSVLQQLSVLQRDFHAVIEHTSNRAVLHDDSSAVAPPVSLLHINSCHSTPLGMWTWSRLPPAPQTPTAYPAIHLLLQPAATCKQLATDQELCLYDTMIFLLHGPQADCKSKRTGFGGNPAVTILHLYSHTRTLYVHTHSHAP